MRKFKLFLKLTNNIFLITCSVLAISLIPYASGKCQNNKSKKLCKIVNKISFPTIFLEKKLKETLEFVDNTKATGNFQKNLGISNNPNETKERFKEYPPGFQFFYEKGSRPNAGFLILSKFNPDENKSDSVQLWDLNNQKIINEFTFYPEAKFYDEKSKNNIFLKHTKEVFLHSIIDSKGSLFFHAGGKLIQLDKCNNLINISNNKTNKIFFHHSINLDNNGKFYVPNNLLIFDKDIHKAKFKNDGFSILDKNLNIIYSTTLLEIYKKNGLLNKIYGMEVKPRDPFHLNDVEPFIRSDGKLIVLLSIRNQSNIIALEVESNKIIWILDNVISRQHDVDILEGSNDLLDISIFDNNAWNYRQNRFSKGNRVVRFYGLPTYPQEDILFISSKKQHEKYGLEIIDFKWMKEELIPKTYSEGLSDFIFENNSLMIEETNYGRLFEVDLDKKEMLWQYINKTKKDAAPFYMKWSRRIPNNIVNLKENYFTNCLIKEK